MSEQDEWSFDNSILDIRHECKMGKWYRRYGVMGAVGRVILDKKYSFMPEDDIYGNRNKLWAVAFLGNGWVRLALYELKIEYELPMELREVVLPDPQTHHTEYIEALDELRIKLKGLNI